MGVKKTMQTFFEGMQGGGSKYGGRIVNTAMGPFKWDQLNESWVNINNGFRLPNISMQDLLLIGYDSISGDNGSAGSLPSYSISNLGELFDFSFLFTEISPNPASIPYSPNTFDTQPTAGITLEVSLSYYSSGNTFSFNGLTGIQLSYTLDDGANFTTLSEANKTIYIEPPIPSLGAGGDGFYFNVYGGTTFASQGLTSGFVITLTNISTPSPEPVSTFTITDLIDDS